MIEKCIINKYEDINEQNEKCFIAEIKCEKPLLRNGIQHARNFSISYKNEEELENILKEFKEVEND